LVAAGRVANDHGKKNRVKVMPPAGRLMAALPVQNHIIRIGTRVTLLSLSGRMREENHLLAMLM
jgi:hypothetical protein